MPGSLHATPILLYAPLVGNLLLAVIAAGYAIGRRSLPPWFWTICLVVLAVLAVMVGAGIVVFVGGARPRRSLHLLYAGLVVVGAVVQYGLRPGGFLRRRYAGELAKSEARTLGLVCLTQFALIARAWMTA